MYDYLDIINTQCDNIKLDKITKTTLLDNEDIIISFNSKDIEIISHPGITESIKFRLNLIFPYILYYIDNYHPDPFDILIALGDKLRKNYGNLPILCFSKEKNIPGFLIPNIDFFTMSIVNFLDQVTLFDHPYRDKSNSSIFTGSSTGPLENNIRLLFCEKSLSNKDRYKSYISNICQHSVYDWIRYYPNLNKYSSDVIKIADQLTHKIVVNIDGNTICWSRLYWQMLSNSIPVYINKNNNEIQYFDFIDHSSAYISTTLDNSLLTIDSILYEYDDNTINKINNYGQSFIKNHFADYMSDPKQFLQTIISNLLLKITT